MQDPNKPGVPPIPGMGAVNRPPPVPGAGSALPLAPAPAPIAATMQMPPSQPLAPSGLPGATDAAQFVPVPQAPPLQAAPQVQAIPFAAPAQPQAPAGPAAPPIAPALEVPQPDPNAAIPSFDSLVGQPETLGADEGWGKLGIAMVAIALLFAGGVAYFIATNGSESGESETIASNTESETTGDSPLAAVATPEAVASAEVADAGPSATIVSADANGGLAVTAEPAAIEPVDVEAPPAEIPGSDALLRANGEVDRPASLVSLTIESQPSGARVVRKRDGIMLGITPFHYEQESASGLAVFVVEKDGYSSTTLKMPASRDGIRQVVLLPGRGKSIAVAAPVVTATPKKSKSVSKTKVAKKRPVSESRPRKKTVKKKPADAKKTKTKSSGKVDYKADPIPFD